MFRGNAASGDLAQGACGAGGELHEGFAGFKPIWTCEVDGIADEIGIGVVDLFFDSR